jgi:hypothetical protein
MILAGGRRAFAPCAGLLVIGDLHVSSRRPGRRTDASWPEPILAKLSAARPSPTSATSCRSSSATCSSGPSSRTWP